MTFDTKHIEDQIDKAKAVDEMIQFYVVELTRKFNYEYYATVMNLLKEYTELKDELRKMVYDTRKLGYKQHTDIQKLVRKRLLH